jgi:TPR repeat protein
MEYRRFMSFALILLSMLYAGASFAAKPVDLPTAAAAGDVHAQFELGKQYNSGRGQEKDTKEAANWFDKAAKKNHHEALFHLGVMYERGRGVAKSVDEAARLYRKAADAGNVDAMYTLSLMYQTGRGVPRDPIQAEFWYQKAIEIWDSAASQ